tara:strand:+ start:264 stop:923 length:660 start_codon:yes stop_codon:yes gene_type:complete
MNNKNIPNNINNTGFYKSFINDIINKPKLNIDKIYLTKNFTNFIIGKFGYTRKSVEILKEILIHLIVKPQRLVVDHEKYYIAMDLYTTTLYMCYKDICMIDIDEKDYNYEEIRTNMPELSYIVYETRKGYHIFLTNKYYNYKDNDTIDLMIKLGADFYNIVFCNLRGFSVRLNKKTTDKDDIYTYIGRYGKGLTEIENLVKEHENSIIKYKDIIRSKMK